LALPLDLAALAPLGRIWRPYLARPAVVVGGVLAAALGAALLLALPVAAGLVLDAARAGDGSAVTRHALWFGAAALAEAGFRYLARRLLIGASRRAEEGLKNRLVRHILRLPIGWFDRARAGDLVSRLTQDVEALRFTTGPALLYGVQALVVLPGGIALVLDTSPWLGLAATLCFAAMFAALRALAPALRRESWAVQDALGAIAERAGEVFGAIRLIQAAHRIAAENRAMGERSAAHLRHGVALARTQARTNLAIHLAGELVLLAGLGFGALAVGTGGATPGELLEFYALLGVQVAPLMALGFVLGGLPRALGAAERVEEVLRVEREARGGDAPGPDPRIEVRGLTFAHPGSRQPVLRDVSLTIEPGQTVGLCGAVGSGKSTLLQLLLRLYDPPRGTVLLDGRDVLDLDPDALRRRFAVALQDPFLFRDRIAENVRFGSEGADVAAAVRDAGLEPDLDALPSGLETVVGERGATLSGGQRQRVALARALAADRSVTMLDDVLSAVDQHTERQVLGKLRARLAGRTVLIATHRLSAVRDADRIVFLERGRVLATGRHEELLARCPPYRRAWRAQCEAAALGEEGP
jgi:ATP-binding cassette subfamily B protein